MRLKGKCPRNKLERQDKGCSKGYDRKMKADYTKTSTRVGHSFVRLLTTNVASTSIASKNLLESSQGGACGQNLC
jgi:hypothetical protein